MKFFLYLFIFLLLTITTNAKKISLDEIKTYFDNIYSLQCQFYHIENDEISTGDLYYLNNRLRVEYTSPQNLLFVFKEKKVMFFNKELMEVQYFRPENTPAQILMNIFNKTEFFSNFDISQKQNNLLIKKSINIEEKVHDLIIYFELNPINIRKIEINGEISNLTFALLNLNFNPNLDNSLFSLANPLLLQN